MADLTDLGFDAGKEEPNNFDLVPPGDYDAVIVKSEAKKTKDGGGKYLNLQLQILNGKYQNRILFDLLNLWNASPEAVKIARGTLSAICRAVNVPTPKDTSELHNKPLRISVGIQKGSDDFPDDKNKIKGYKARQSGPAPSDTQAMPATTMADTVAQQPW